MHSHLTIWTNASSRMLSGIRTVQGTSEDWPYCESRRCCRVGISSSLTAIMLENRILSRSTAHGFSSGNRRYATDRLLLLPSLGAPIASVCRFFNRQLRMVIKLVGISSPYAAVQLPVLPQRSDMLVTSPVNRLSVEHRTGRDENPSKSARRRSLVVNTM